MEDTLTEAELQALRDWAASHPVYQAYWDRVQDGEFINGSLKAVAELQDVIGQSWLQRLEQTVLERIDVPRKQLPNRWRARAARALIAAAFLSALSIGYYFWRNSQPKPEQLTSVYGDDVLPGGSRATLTLTDGRVITLDEAQTGIVIDEQDITYSDGSSLGLPPASGDSGRLSDVEELVLTTPKGGQYQVTLPDGSRVWLNAASMLKYPSRFLENERIVQLEGEAYFDVSEIRGTRDTHAPAKNNDDVVRNPVAGARVSRVPFKVQTFSQTVEVLGTEFNISAYADEKETRTTLVEGKVKVALDGDGQANTQTGLPDYILTPGQQAITRSAAIQIKTVDVQDHIAWRDGLILFNHAGIREVAKEIERWYDVSFVIPPAMDKGQAYIILNRNEKLSEVLAALEKTYEVHFRIKGKEVTVTE